jgi:PTS system nitrogen regulatory IIA component
MPRHLYEARRRPRVPRPESHATAAGRPASGPETVVGMDIADFIAADRVALDLRARDKPQLLQELARRAAATGAGVPADAILAALRSREDLGSTGLGKGFALPHARIDGLPKFFGLFARLARAIDYDAIDGNPVDLVFLLLMPANAGNEHVAALAAVSRRFRDAEAASRLRKADAATVLAMLTAR